MNLDPPRVARRVKTHSPVMEEIAPDTSSNVDAHAPDGQSGDARVGGCLFAD